MSNWTHVAGIVRVDSIRFMMDTPDFDSIFGRECTYGSSEDTWNDFINMDYSNGCFLPFGSEGTLHKEVWVNPCKSEIAAYTVAIFGDLRDHDNPLEIINWFKECINTISNSDNAIGVRNAVITAVNECNGTETWEFVEEENE